MAIAKNSNPSNTFIARKDFIEFYEESWKAAFRFLEEKLMNE